MDRLMRMGGLGMKQPPPGTDSPQVDTAETIYISSLALLKMLKHGRAGVPMEVMGLMLGEFVDDYTVRCIDVFAMPQSGTGVSVEAVDPVFQTKMLDMLKQTGRPAVVVDPIQSVKGKVVIDAFRSINPQMTMMGYEPRQTTSNVGHIQKPSIQALIHGLNRHYYSINISYRKNELEQKMLLNLYHQKWTKGLNLQDFAEHSKANEETLKKMNTLATKYEKLVKDEIETDAETLAIDNVGKQDPKKHLQDSVDQMMASNIGQCLGAMIDTIIF